MKVLFVHVPKTGGTSIKKFLEDNHLEIWNRKWPMGHDPYFELESLNDFYDTFKFAIVRNPYTRLYSYYHHFKFQNNTELSFIEFLNFIRLRRSTPQTPMISYNQSFYVFDKVGNMSLSKLYRYENLKEFEEDFEIKLEYLRKGNYTKANYFQDYTEEAISLVKHLFLEDFINFNYSFNFQDAN